VTLEIVATVAAGLGAGLLSGLFGVGGGLLFVPALFFIAGLSHVEAAATSLAAMIPVVIAGTWRQHGHGNVRWRAAGVIGIASAAGAYGGAVLAEALPEDVLRKLFAILLLVVAARLVWSARGLGEEA
jgi:uncharacterized membrane protein YfcA